MRLVSARNQSFQFGIARFCAVETFGKSAGVEFDELAAGSSCSLDLSRIRRNEQAYVYACRVDFFSRLRQGSQVSDDIEAAFGCDFLPALGDQTNDLWLELEADRDNFRRVGHFEI